MTNWGEHEERYLEPDDVSPAQLAHADQHVAEIARWVDDALFYLEAHVEAVHENDASRCAAYCGDEELFRSVDKLEQDELQMLVLQLLHAEMRHRRLVRLNRG